MPKRKTVLGPGHDGYVTRNSRWRQTPPPRPQPIRLPNTAQIDARIRRQTTTYRIWREQYLRLKDPRTGHGRWWAGPRPTKPPNPVVVSTLTPEGSPPSSVLVFTRAPERRHPFGTVWQLPQVATHPTLGPLYHLDSCMVMNQQLLRTIPSRRLLVSRGPTPDASVVFKALAQEWVRVPSNRGSPKSVVGYHRWVCAVVRLDDPPRQPVTERRRHDR